MEGGDRMPIRDHDLTISHMTERDTSLTHQIVLQKPHNSNDVYASCNCRLKYDTGHTMGYEPMGKANDIADARILYNNPKNHWKPFTAKDVAKW